MFTAFISLLALLSPLSFSAFNASAADFSACAAFDRKIDRAVQKWFPDDLEFPVLWRAQLYQESLCDPKAVSPVGAKGIAQFMPATARDVASRFGVRFDPTSDLAIDYGAYYQARQMRVFARRGRTSLETWPLGLAAYNSGLGNVLKTQSKCGNARLWPEIKNCQHLVTGPRNAHETLTYVDRIERWSLEMAGDDLAALPVDLQKKKADRIIDEATRRFGVRRYFSGLAWGTYWQVWDGWITADHVYRQVRANPPAFAVSPVIRAPGVVDAAYFGESVPDQKPRSPREGERVYIVGFPGGSDRPSLRYGRVHVKRQTPGNPDYSNADTIILIEAQAIRAETAGFEPVTGGMSGGLVMSETYEPLCVLVSQNGMTDLTGDGRPDASADCVPLADIWEVFHASSSN